MGIEPVVTAGHGPTCRITSNARAICAPRGPNDVRQRARAEDRIRGLKDNGLQNLPPHEFATNIIWLELIQLAAELLTWTRTLAFTGSAARTWEPKRLRLRLLHMAGRIVTIGRRRWLRRPRGWPWADHVIGGHARLHAVP